MINDLSPIDVAILCGGLGQRLRPAISEAPKVMAQVGKRPFLDFIFEHLEKQGFRRIILLTGYKAQEIEDYYQKTESRLIIEFSREDHPLGTGGALKNAQEKIKGDPFLVLNGDSFCPLDYNKFLQFHFSKKAWVTLVVSRPMPSEDVGKVRLSDSGRIMEFTEKPKSGSLVSFTRDSWYVNAGIYCFSREVFDSMPTRWEFSLEKDWFPQLVRKEIYGFYTEEKFFDIGTPQRYQEACDALK